MQVFSIEMMVISDSILLCYLPWEQKAPFTCWAQMKSRKLSIWPQTLKSLKQTWYMLLTMSLEDPMVSIQTSLFIDQIQCKCNSHSWLSIFSGAIEDLWYVVSREERDGFCSQKNRKRNGVSFSALAAMPLAELQRDKRGEMKHQHVKSHICACSSSS